MKKLLFGILTFLGIGLSFCSADYFVGFITFSFSDSISFGGSAETYYGFSTGTFNPKDGVNTIFSGDSVVICFKDSYPSATIKDSLGNDVCSFNNNVCCPFSDGQILNGDLQSFYLFINNDGGGSSSCEDKSIDVYYNNGNTESILCDGTQAIEIKGLSTITSTNTFTPYYNISYTDEDNQKLTESYSKSNLYLSGGLFKKTYTGDNERILTDTIESPNSSFSGYLPTFEITGSVDPNDEFTGNVFNNFADNSLKFLFSNIPSYIQYFIILSILFLILGFVKKFKRK